ncbi:MAG TPA: pitrilysin family protein [Gemmatimonadaceae bacterium]|nr:pitrilysin family protein [Gemmatimonadaceae bacterium]
MRKQITIALTGLCLASAAAAQTAPVVSKFDVAGIPVIFKPVRANDVVAVRLYLRGGSANLSAGTAGIESLMLNSATGGTRKYNKDAFNALATSTGTAIGADVSVDYSVLTLQAVRQHWNEAWDLFTEASLRPTFPAPEVEIVRGQLVDAAKRRADDPDTYLNFLADSMLYAGHPYSMLPTGTAASLTGITRESLVTWHRERMAKENLLIVVVGNATRADVESKIRASFGTLPAKGRTAGTLARLGAITPELYVVKRDLPTNYITGFFGAPTLSDPDYVAFRVATDVLGNRLFEEVRTKRNMTYAVAAGLESRMANRGRLYVTAVEPDTTLKVIFSEVKRLQNEPVPRERLAETANASLTNYLMRQQTNMGQAAALGLWELVGGGWQNYDRFVRGYRRVTPADVQRVAKKYMTKARFAVIGDPAKVSRALVIGF